MWFLRLFSRLPFWFIYALSSLLSFIVFRIFGYRKMVIRKNLRQAFPEKPAAWHQAVERKFYRNFTDLWLETIKALALSPGQLVQRVSYQNHSLLLNPLNRGQSCLVLTSHIGNWEWILLRFSSAVNFQIDAAYQRISSPLFDRLMYTIRTRFGANMFERRKFLRALINRRQEARMIAMAADQGPSLRKEQKYWHTFMNQPASFYLAAEKIARSQNLPVIYAAMTRIRRGCYQVTFQEIASPPYDQLPEHSITDRYVALIERNIRQQPESYLWSHRRWRRRPLPEDTIRTD